MTNIAGIDGCKSGWICVYEELPSRRIGSKVFATIDDLAKYASGIDIIAIDIPIGLNDAGPRLCDVAARKMLGPKRGTSVFPAPLRCALSAATYEEACDRSFAAQKKKLPKQSWAIYPKIRELDALLTTQRDLRSKIFEVHPEVSFCAWNDGLPIVEKKKSDDGHSRRRSLIDSHFGTSAYDEVRKRYKGRDVADDDILDAFAALWTAERIARGAAATLPSNPPLDEHELPMRMVY